MRKFIPAKGEPFDKATCTKFGEPSIAAIAKALGTCIVVPSAIVVGTSEFGVSFNSCAQALGIC